MCAELETKIRLVSQVVSGSVELMTQSLHPKELARRTGEAQQNVLYAAGALELMRVPASLTTARRNARRRAPQLRRRLRPCESVGRARRHRSRRAAAPRSRQRSARWRRRRSESTAPAAPERAASRRGISCQRVRARRDRSAAATAAERADASRGSLVIPIFAALVLTSRRRPQLGRGDRLRRRRRHRSDRRLPRAPLARRVVVREDRRPARGPAADRHGRHPALARGPPAVGRAADPAA